MREGIYVVCVNSRRATRRKHDVGRANGNILNAVLHSVVDGKNARNRSVVDKYAYCLRVIKNGNSLPENGVLKHLGHLLRGVRADRGRSAIWVVVGLVADVLAVVVGRKLYAEVCKLHKALCGVCRLAKSNVTIHSATAEKRFCHIHNAVALVARERKLIIGLLVASRISRRSRVLALGHDSDIFVSEVVKPVRAVIARAARADHDRIKIICSHIIPFPLKH